MLKNLVPHAHCSPKLQLRMFVFMFTQPFVIVTQLIFRLHYNEMRPKMPYDSAIDHFRHISHSTRQLNTSLSLSLTLSAYLLALLSSRFEAEKKSCQEQQTIEHQKWENQSNHPSTDHKSIFNSNEPNTVWHMVWAVLFFFTIRRFVQVSMSLIIWFFLSCHLIYASDLLSSITLSNKSN